MKLLGCSPVLTGLIAVVLTFSTVTKLPLFLAQQPGAVASPPALTRNLPGKIAFVSNRDGAYEIYTMKADGSNVVQMTHDKANDWYPSWSADGRRIVYTSQRGSRYNQIFRMDADGSEQVQLTTDAYDHLRPRWSPDGRRIIFVSKAQTTRQIYVMDADGSHITSLTATVGAENRAPTWSPDGKHIAFDSSRDLTDPQSVFGDIYVMDADGSHPTRITHDGVSIEPAWAPDGKRLAITSSRAGGTTASIWLIAADGTGARPLASSRIHDTGPAWSPDNKYIAILHHEAVNTSNYQIYVLSVNGAQRLLLTDDTSDNLLPSWTR